jgi:para-aminobenzoate synthetase component 1
MISTISCKAKKNVHPVDIIKACFPMGSMTGAPKIKAMELIEKYESSKRGLFSGAVGYFSPDGNFDFNVVIRSILYNRLNYYLSVMVGGAITAKANAEDEYNECLLKASAMMQALSGETKNVRAV